MKKNHAEIIHEEFSENIDIQLEIDIESADKFIESIRELSARSDQIIMKK